MQQATESLKGLHGLDATSDGVPQGQLRRYSSGLGTSMPRNCEDGIERPCEVVEQQSTMVISKCLRRNSDPGCDGETRSHRSLARRAPLLHPRVLSLSRGAGTHTALPLSGVWWRAGGERKIIQAALALGVPI